MRPLPSLQEHAVFLALTCFMFRDKQQLEICLLTHPLIQVIVSSSNGRENSPLHCTDPHFEVH